ncbi:hypothetical protein [Nitrosococcus wardiae]|uniref:Uncharacterized protein n=1 Tax=Nitrosococcus wardiae TaxID=1814290 RepID=A0A4P7BX36_9GAMM|nr:hypothetical protein [Nitrosococcus wardiae]QBQ54541.1 hypothetical protein E3U44_08485 [Nitrosococcus wardiae]
MREISYGVVLGIFMLALLLGSCSAVRLAYPTPVDELSIPPPNHLAPDPNNLELLLRYYRGLRSLSEVALRQELDRAWQATAKEPTAFDRLRLILLLSLPETPFQDLEQAREMLHDFLETENTEGLCDLALLLQEFVMEEAQQKRHYRLLQEQLQQKEEQVRRLRSGLKYLDGRRKQEQEWAKSLEKQLEDERGRAETLEQKLEALKTIEKRLEHRNQSKESLELPEQGKELDE